MSSSPPYRNDFFCFMLHFMMFDVGQPTINETIWAACCTEKHNWDRWNHWKHPLKYKQTTSKVLSTSVVSKQLKSTEISCITKSTLKKWPFSCSARHWGLSAEAKLAKSHLCTAENISWFNTYHTTKWCSCIPSLSNSKTLPLEETATSFWIWDERNSKQTS